MLVEVVTSALNEEKNIAELFSQLKEIFEVENKYEWRLTIFDNGSTDNTWNEIVLGASQDVRIIGFQMSRTFNFDHALSAGIEQSNADALILMTSDLQDPPNVISQFLRAWESGSDHVVARVLKRAEMSILRKFLTKIYYLFSNWATNDLIQENVSDFRLMDRKVYQSFREMKERYRFTRGMIAWTGFNTTYIDIERPPRFSGKTKAKYPSLIFFGLKGILSNSSKPLNYVSVLGMVLSTVSIFSIFIFIYFWLTNGVPFGGFGTLLGFLLLTFSIQIFVVGVLGQYIGLIYEEVQNRPLYFIKQKFEKKL
jgi:glycosyltransferase involved in cell wall biosynthesis